MAMAFCIFCKVLLFFVKSILVDYEQEEKEICSKPKLNT